jgi:hypothetical protein
MAAPASLDAVDWPKYIALFDGTDTASLITKLSTLPPMQLPSKSD